MTTRKPSLLITGGAGFIGSTLVRQCLAEGDSLVVNLDKFTYAGHRSSLEEVENHPDYVLVEGDIVDAKLVGEVLEEHRPWAIVHLAAETHVDRSIVDPPTFAVTNVLGTCTLLDVATRYWQQLDVAGRARFRFLYVSTDEVFGSAGPEQAFDEQSPVSPNSPYAASKAAGEQLTGAFAHTYGLPTLVANPSNHYGPRQHPEKLIPKMILHAAAGEPLGVYGDGLHQRDWLHVEDGCRVLRAILRQGSPGERYLVGADNCQVNLAVVETICDLVDELLADNGQRRKLIAHVTDRLGHDRRYAVCANKVRETTGWQPTVSFSVGLRETVAWYLQHRQWVEKMWATEVDTEVD
ncbi:MAG: dTDP-glucose 4,6-dehydratase [Planctomycetes bacterium]|nr:dTDP-glucose 4,6-dehydratase [Planctomycetota bacterium]